MEYVLIKELRDLVAGNSYDIRYAWTNTIPGKMYVVIDYNKTHIISEQELEEYFIPMTVYRRNKIIEELL